MTGIEVSGSLESLFLGCRMPEKEEIIGIPIVDITGSQLVK